MLTNEEERAWPSRLGRYELSRWSVTDAHFVPPYRIGAVKLKRYTVWLKTMFRMYTQTAKLLQKVSPQKSASKHPRWARSVSPIQSALVCDNTSRFRQSVKWNSDISYTFFNYFQIFKHTDPNCYENTENAGHRRCLYCLYTHTQTGQRALIWQKTP